MVVEGTSDPIIERLIAQDKTPWYKKPNLRYLYLFLVPCCLGIESTSGFDSSLMNGLQSLSFWQSYFGKPAGATLGILNASYSLGAVTALPFVTYLSDHVGRRWSIVFGSTVMVIGAIMQAFSVNSTFRPSSNSVLMGYVPLLIPTISGHVDLRSNVSRSWNCLLYSCGF